MMAQAASGALVAAGMMLSITLVLFSSLVWFAEKGEWDEASKQWLRMDGEPTPFTSIPATMWWCMVTFTTVGYGDMWPISTCGQCFGALAMIFGLLSISLPIAAVASHFEQALRPAARECTML